MADDSETKRLALELNQDGKLSTPKMLDEFGFSFQEEKEGIKENSEFQTELGVSQAIAQAEAQGRAMEIQARYQVRAEEAALDERAKLREKKFKDELSKENAKSQEVDVSEIISKYAEELLLMGPEEQQTSLIKLQEKMPYTAAMIMQRIQEKNMSEGGVVEEQDMAPEEEQPQPAKKKKSSDNKSESQKKTQGAPKKGV